MTYPTQNGDPGVVKEAAASCSDQRGDGRDSRNHSHSPTEELPRSRSDQDDGITSCMNQGGSGGGGGGGGGDKGGGSKGGGSKGGK